MTGRRLLAAVLCAVLVGVLGGCGDPGKAYCDALKADQPTFAQLSEDTTGVGLLQHVAMLQRLDAKAPDDLKDEWQTFLDAIEAFAATLRRAGVKPGDFVDGKPPVGLSADVRTEIATAADELSSPDVVDAASGIEQQAKDVCKVQLGLS